MKRMLSALRVGLMPFFWGGLICLLVTTIAVAQSAQLRWRWSNPLPHGNNIMSMAQANGVFVQVCERGQLYASDDLATWIPQNTGTTNSLRSAVFFGNRLVVTGEKGTVLYADALDDFKPGRLLDGSNPVVTSDWLEGVAAGQGTLVAVGDNGTIYTSTDGIDWKRQRSGFSTWLRSVAYGAGIFVAVGERGFVATSSNGNNWQQRVSGATADLNKVVWMTNSFLAVGTGGVAIASLNGIQWASVNTQATNVLFAAAGNGIGRLVAGDSEVRLQEGILSWSNELALTKSFPAPKWTYLSALWDANLTALGSYLLAGRTGMLIEGFKTNSTGQTFWLPFDDSVRNWLWEVRRTPVYDLVVGDYINVRTNFYIAVGDRATVMTSTDGLDWELQPAPSSMTNAVFLGIGGGTNGLIAVGSQGNMIYSPNLFLPTVTTNLLVTGSVTNSIVQTNWVNTLGEWWIQVFPSTQNDLQGVGAKNGLFVVTGGAGTIRTSTNGANWRQQSSPVTEFLSSVEPFPGGWVAVGNAGTILTSSDAVTWTKRVSGTTNWIYRVRWLDGLLVAVGENGALLTSTNAIQWVSLPSGTSSWLNDAVKVGAAYYVVGTQGAVLTSSNAVSWTNIGAITQKSLYGAATHGGKLVVVGVEGIILRSQVVPQLDPIYFQYNHSLSAESVLTNRFIFSGRLDQRFTLDTSLDLVNWETGPEFEFLDSSELLIFMEELSSPPKMEFYKPTLR